MTFFKVVLWLQLSLFVWLQAGLWLGTGSLVELWQLDQRVADKRAQTIEKQTRNASLLQEIVDLKGIGAHESAEAIEEKARLHLGMIRPNESFFVITNPRE